MDTFESKPESFGISFQEKYRVSHSVVQEKRVVWHKLMSVHHYLGFKSLFGSSIRYAAVLEVRWLTLALILSISQKNHKHHYY